MTTGGLDQHTRNPYQRHYHPNYSRNRWHLPNQQNPQNNSSCHLLGCKQVGIRCMHSAYRGIVQCMPYTKRKYSQGHYSTYCRQGIRESMLKRKKKGNRHKPERSKSIDIRCVAEKRMTVTFSASRDRVDSEAKSR